MGRVFVYLLVVSFVVGVVAHLMVFGVLPWNCDLLVALALIGAAVLVAALVIGIVGFVRLMRHPTHPSG